MVRVRSYHQLPTTNHQLPAKEVSQLAGKPNSVRLRDGSPLGLPPLRRDDHSSRPGITRGLERPTRWPRTGRPSSAVAGAYATLFGLAPCGVLPATDVAAGAVRSYRTFSPLPRLPEAVFFLCHWSVKLPCPGVTRRTALWSSDFPPPPALRGTGHGFRKRRSSSQLRRTIVAVFSLRSSVFGPQFFLEPGAWSPEPT